MYGESTVSDGVQTVARRDLMVRAWPWQLLCERLNSWQKVHECYVCGAGNSQMAQAGLGRGHEDSSESSSVSREAFAGMHESSVMLGVLGESS
jgi:hypothetical protein